MDNHSFFKIFFILIMIYYFKLFSKTLFFFI